MTDRLGAIWGTDEVGRPYDRPLIRPAAGSRGGRPVTGVCRACGHTREGHRHYRPGADCALCTCPRFRRFLLRGAR